MHKNHPALHRFVNAAIDLAGLNQIIDGRVDLKNIREFCCVFEDGRVEWHEVPKKHQVRKTWELMLKNKAKNEPAVEIIHDLAKWNLNEFIVT